jgi:hypothetical protein
MMLKGELENNSRNLRDLVSKKNWHSGSHKKIQPTLSWGKKKKGDEVDDEDNDVVNRVCHKTELQ